MEEKQCFLYNNCNHRDCNKSFCLRKYKMEELYNLSLIPEAQRKHIILRIDADGTDYDQFVQLKEIETNILSFVEDGKNLYIHSSNCGNGKTSMSLRLIEAYFNKIWPQSTITCRALFINVPRFLLETKNNISEYNEYISFIKEFILEADLVVWDDIAAKVGTEFELSHLLSLIDSRISRGKSNIYTSNLNPNEMTAAVGARLASRICNYSIDIELNGADKRKLMSK